MLRMAKMSNLWRLLFEKRRITKGMNIIQSPANIANYTRSYSPRKVSLIVIHVEAGSEAGTTAWFANPNAHVSAHYSISKTGEIHQHVAENDIAWHAGIPSPCTWNVQAKNPQPGVNPNSYSIGIEHEGQAGDAWPIAQVEASAALIADICKKHGLLANDTNIVQHHEIYAGHNCPGPGCPFEELLVEANKILGPMNPSSSLGRPTK